MQIMRNTCSARKATIPSDFLSSYQDAEKVALLSCPTPATTSPTRMGSPDSLFAKKRAFPHVAFSLLSEAGRTAHSTIRLMYSPATAPDTRQSTLRPYISFLRNRGLFSLPRHHSRQRWRKRGWIGTNEFVWTDHNGFGALSVVIQRQDR